MAYPKCTYEVINDAFKLKKNGMNNKDICAYLGINETTFYRWMNDFQDEMHCKFRESLKKAESEYKSALRSYILKAAENKDWKAAAWMLERQYPEEYARKAF